MFIVTYDHDPISEPTGASSFTVTGVGICKTGAGISQFVTARAAKGMKARSANAAHRTKCFRPNAFMIAPPDKLELPDFQSPSVASGANVFEQTQSCTWAFLDSVQSKKIRCSLARSLQ